jgi:Holliday junction resolvasome RuvABC DNA-binding subunit
MEFVIFLSIVITIFNLRKKEKTKTSRLSDSDCHEAVDILIQLGFNKKQAVNRVFRARMSFPGASVEFIVNQAIK